LAFFSVGALCVMGGMIWGSVMGSSQDFTMAPAHAHLNLLGWASLALMGTFYALSGRGGRLGWINFGLSTAGLAVMVPFLVMVLNGKKGAEGGIIAGSVLAMAGMAVFLYVVLSSWRDAKSA
jgi:hypothetical protein